MRAGKALRWRSAGYAYVLLLTLLGMLATAMAVTAEHVHTLTQRQKELDWLFIGKQYQQAIASYYHRSPQGIKTLPRATADLLQDPRYVSTVRHLRKVYADPLTNGQWQEVRNPEGMLVGFRSTSTQTVQLKKLLADAGYNQPDLLHRDVIFVYKAATRQRTTTPATPTSSGFDGD